MAKLIKVTVNAYACETCGQRWLLGVIGEVRAKAMAEACEHAHTALGKAGNPEEVPAETQRTQSDDRYPCER